MTDPTLTERAQACITALRRARTVAARDTLISLASPPGDSRPLSAEWRRRKLNRSAVRRAALACDDASRRAGVTLDLRAEIRRLLNEGINDITTTEDP